MHSNMTSPRPIDVDLAAPVWPVATDYPGHEPSEIAPGLFMGGTADDDTIANAGLLARFGGPRPFEAVVTLYAGARPVSWQVAELRYGFGDGALEAADLDRIVAAAVWAHARWAAGDRVLVRCQAGLNRSGLVTALVLMLAGWEPADAIAQLRAARSPHALCNPAFVAWLLRDADAWLGPYRAAPAA